jgi:hypothetical protein
MRWFNKPKFHIFIHLTEHIQQFGPAILFAMEAFKSFNAIIQAKSVHSNCHASSQDIGYAFAQGNCIHHLLSGGYFNFPLVAVDDQAQPFLASNSTTLYVPQPFSHTKNS